MIEADALRRELGEHGALGADRRLRAGLPLRPEGLIFGMMKLQQLIKDRRGHWPDRAIGPTVPEGI